MRFEDTFDGIGAGPVVAGAAALGILIGLAGGTSIDTTPLQRGQTLDQLIPDRQPATYDPARHAPAPYRPDHYPQLTRNGRIEVPELRAYILRHERPADFVYAGEFAAPEGETTDEIPEPAASAYPEPVPGDHLTSRVVPGNLEHATAPVSDEAVLEPVPDGYSPQLASTVLSFH